MDCFGPVGPWAKLLETAVVNPWSEPRQAEKKDGLSRDGVLSSLGSNCEVLPSPSQPSRDCLLSASGFLCACYVLFLFLFLIRLSLGTRSLHQRAFCILDLTDTPPFIQMFLYVCAWACHDTGQSCCGISVPLPGSALPPLCLTKPFIVFSSLTAREGIQPWEVGGRQGQV